MEIEVIYKKRERSLGLRSLSSLLNQWLPKLDTQKNPLEVFKKYWLMPCSHAQHFDKIHLGCNLHFRIFLFLNPGDFIVQQSLETTDWDHGFTGFGRSSGHTLSALSLLKTNDINDDCSQVSFPPPLFIIWGKMKQLSFSHDFS